MEKEIKDVLLVEDEEALLHVLSEKLQDSGLVVDTASHGKAALYLMEKYSYKVILLDILMPEMNGQEFLNELRKNPEYHKQQVIILSNMSDSANVSKATLNGVIQYIVKVENTLEQITGKVKMAVKNVK